MTELADLVHRLEQLEAEKHIRSCMNNYMAQCDRLDEYSDLDELMHLFTEDAVWEGIGELYSKRLGRYVGNTAIRKMFAKYTQSPSHFSFNLHVLGNEMIEVTDKQANGSWLLIQPSDFVDGRSHLNAARIRCQFKTELGEWKICHFQTENLFSRKVDKPWFDLADLPVPE